MFAMFFVFTQLFGASANAAGDSTILPRHVLEEDISSSLKNADILTFHVLDEVNDGTRARIVYRLSFLPRSGVRMITRIQAVATYSKKDKSKTSEWTLVEVSPSESEAQFVDATEIIVKR